MAMEDFSFIAVLGSGMFGKVLLSEYKQTKELFAIKTMWKSEIVDKDRADRLMQERRVLELGTRAQHPFLVHVFACFQTERHACFLLEYSAGGDLKTHAGPVASRSLRLAHDGLFVTFLSRFFHRFYAACAVLGLEFLHKNNIAHGDIKMDNLLLDSEGYLKISDFGNCKEGVMGFDDDPIWQTQYDQTAKILMKSNLQLEDWRWLGMVLYEMLVGQSPFYWRSHQDKRCYIIRHPISYPDCLSTRTVQIIEQLIWQRPYSIISVGAWTVKSHRYFKGIAWDDLLAKKIRPPWVPTINNPKDVGNFGVCFTEKCPNLTPPRGHRVLREWEQAMFEDFDLPFSRREANASATENVMSE
ncbi:hypothetical protein GJAV_G00050610 [Gymnothorax javanicus]|nr:hypothetical protein GJAV_G00050610 [Gymnothorax javanicus]